MKRYLSILFVTLALLLVGPNYVLAESNTNVQSEEQIVLEAPTLYNGMGSVHVQQYSYLSIRAEGAYAESTDTIDGYELYLETSNGYELVDSNETFEDIQVITDIGEKETYVAKVYAYDSNNEKVYSDYSNELVIDNTLVAPVLVNARGSMGAPQYSYLNITSDITYGENPDRIAGYEVYLKTTKGYKLVGSMGALEEFEVITELGDKEVYVARVYAYNLDNEKVYSTYSNELVIDNTLNVPTFTITNSYYKSLRLTWTHNDWMVAGYKIYRATSKNGKYSYVATVKASEDDYGQTLTYNDTNKTFNKTYYYKIRPYHVAEDGTTHNGSYSAIKSKKVVTPAPSVEGTTVGFLKNKLTWNKVTGASGYAIYKLVDGKYTLIKTTTSLSYTDTLKNSKTELEFTNSYKVRAYRTVSGKKVYGPYSEVITLESQMSTPKLTYVGIDHTSYQLTGSTISGSTAIELYSCADATCAEDGRTLVVSEAKLDETITVNSMAETQYYIVRAVRTIKGESIYSDFSQVYTFSAKPVTIDVTNENVYAAEADSKTSIMIAINNSLENQSFEIYRSTSKTGTYELTDSVSCTTLIDLMLALYEAMGYTPTEEEIEEMRAELAEEQYINICYDTDVKVGKTYYYKVRAVMVEDGVTYYGELSEADSVKVKPAQVSVTTSPYKYNSTIITWDSVTDADGYEVYRATSKKGKYTKVKTTNGDITSYKHSGTLNKTYYYKVRAYYLDENGKKVYGSYSSIASRKIRPLTSLDTYPVELTEDYSTTIIKSLTVSKKSTVGSSVVYKFKFNFTKTWAEYKHPVYFYVDFYDKDYNYLTTIKFDYTIPKGTKKNYSITKEQKLPKEAVYYEFR